MQNIMYGNTSPKAFLAAAEKHVEKLTFNTREEYLNWVKEWKEDYKYLSAWQRIGKLHRFTKKEKVDRAEKQVAEIKVKFPHAKYNETVTRVKDRLVKEYDIKWGTNDYTLIRYMLVIRKASKLRSAIKRQERILSEQTAA